MNANPKAPHSALLEANLGLIAVSPLERVATIDFVPTIQPKVTQEHDMPMRGKLPIPAIQSNISKSAGSSAWAVIGFCLTGLAISMYVAASSQPLDQISLLIIQYNLW